MKTPPIWSPGRFAVLWLAVGLILWGMIFSLDVAFGQEGPPDINVQKHYRMFVLTPLPEAGVTIRAEYHLMVGAERSASLFFGGVEGEPAPRHTSVVVGNNEFNEDGTLCFVVDEIEGETPESVIGERACFVYDREADTMAPINDPTGIVLEDCGRDHTGHFFVPERPRVRA